MKVLRTMLLIISLFSAFSANAQARQLITVGY